MNEYIRTNNEGTKVLDYDELDMAARTNFLTMLDNWADNIDVDLSETDASNAERAEAIDGTVDITVDAALAYLSDDEGDEPEVDDGTKDMIKERISKRLAERYSVEL